MIGIYLSKDMFEYEVRGLVMAFFPSVSIKVWKAEQVISPEENFEHQLEICFGKEELTVGYFNKDTHQWKRCSSPMNYENRRAGKTILKGLLYEVLSKETKKDLPWGTLTGIRPTKIPMELLEDGKSRDEIINIMEDVYRCSKKKSKLSVDIAVREKQILKNIDYENGYSLYIGIPFCPTTCLYCSFTSYHIGKWEKRIDDYLEALFKELTFTAKHFQNKKLNTIYFGGGTPTTLPAEAMDRLIQKIKDNFDLSHLLEFTVEAGRPDSITKEKLEVLRKHGISRISINPQTMNDKTLQIIGRRHSVSDVVEAFKLARSLGFDNINMDLILGLPNETINDVRHTMDEIKKLNPDNITVHSLALKRAAKLNMFREEYQDLHFENTEEIMQLTADYASMLDLHPYYLYRQKNIAGNLENVGYAKEGKAGIYNILIMEEKQTIVACGAGASTKAVFSDKIERAENVKDVDLYIERIDEMIERKKKTFNWDE